MTRNLSEKDLLEIDEMHMKRKAYLLGQPQKDKRKKDRRVAINSYVDPSMERRFFTRRKVDREGI